MFVLFRDHHLTLLYQDNNTVKRLCLINCDSQPLQNQSLNVESEKCVWAVKINLPYLYNMLYMGKELTVHRALNQKHVGECQLWSTCKIKRRPKHKLNKMQVKTTFKLNKINHNVQLYFSHNIIVSCSLFSFIHFHLLPTPSQKHHNSKFK